MSAEFHDLADLVANTFCALLGIKTVRPSFYQQLAASKGQVIKPPLREYLASPYEALEGREPRRWYPK
jgi:hypothetical protein